MLSVLVPDATRNYVANPSLEVTGTSGWTALLTTAISRSRNRARFGRASLYCNCPGIAAREGAYVTAGTVPAGSPVTGSIYARGTGMVFPYLQAADNGLIWYGTPVTLNDRHWQRLVISGVIGASAEANLRLAVATYFNNAAKFYVDGAQVELKPYATTYCDGDEELALAAHEGNAFFEWVGQRHLTQSFRSKSYRKGGYFLDLSRGVDYELYPTEASGLGTPPFAIASQMFAGQEVAMLQAIKPLPRAVELTFTARRKPGREECDPQSLGELRKARNALLEVLKPDRVGGVQAGLLRYQDGLVPGDLDIVYEAGMEWTGDIRDPHINEFGLRLLCPDPYWRVDSQDVATVSVSTVPTTSHAFLVARLAGEWTGFGSASFPIRVLAVHPNGDVYAGGDFTNIGGVACRHIARWDGTAWNVLAGVGSDIDNGTVYAIAFAPDGTVFIGGTFTAIGGVTYNRVAKYDPTANTFSRLIPANPGVNSDVNAIACSSDGYAYLGGAFTATTSGTNAYRVVRYNIAADTWTAIGTHSGVNLDVECLAMDVDGTTLLLGGQFTDEETHVGGTALSRFCKYTAASGFEAVSEVGVNGTVRAMKVALDGKVYIGGDFTLCGFMNCTKAAVWNRQEWYPLGSDADGLTGGTRVNAISIDNRGNVYYGGDFTAATGADLASYLAVWNGTRWSHLDIAVGASVLAVAAKFDKLFVGFDGASVSSVADVQTVTNYGAAKSYPVLDVLGPVTLRWLENQDTGKVVRMNLAVLAGERVLLDLRPGYLKAYSEWRGNVMLGISADSDFGDFYLLPGENVIAFHGTGGTGSEEVSLRWVGADWSFDEAR